MSSLVVLAVMAGGCATYTPDPRASNIDYEKVAHVENVARAYGVSVYWVNYPTKSSSSVN
jgi:hypothetical protein